MKWLDRGAFLERIDGEFTGRHVRRFTAYGVGTGRVVFEDRKFANCHVYAPGLMETVFASDRARCWKRAKALVEHAERIARCSHEWRRHFMRSQRPQVICGKCGKAATGKRARAILRLDD